jgi:hypothetical protein
MEERAAELTVDRMGLRRERGPLALMIEGLAVEDL